MSRGRPHVPGSFEPSERTSALYLVPSPDTPGLTPAERLALTLRRDATIAGRCVCGATMPAYARVRPGDEMPWFEMNHEHDCPAADGQLFDRMLERIGGRRALRWDAVEVKVKVKR